MWLIDVLESLDVDLSQLFDAVHVLLFQSFQVFFSRFATCILLFYTVHLFPLHVFVLVGLDFILKLLVNSNQLVIFFDLSKESVLYLCGQTCDL